MYYTFIKAFCMCAPFYLLSNLCLKTFSHRLSETLWTHVGVFCERVFVHAYRILFSCTLYFFFISFASSFFKYTMMITKHDGIMNKNRSNEQFSSHIYWAKKKKKRKYLDDEKRMKWKCTNTYAPLIESHRHKAKTIDFGSFYFF